MRETDTKEYWDKKWAFGEHRRERVFLDGSDGEEEFDRELHGKTIRKIVLDEGLWIRCFYPQDCEESKARRRDRHFHDRAQTRGKESSKKQIIKRALPPRRCASSAVSGQ